MGLVADDPNPQTAKIMMFPVSCCSIYYVIVALITGCKGDLADGNSSDCSFA